MEEVTARIEMILSRFRVRRNAWRESSDFRCFNFTMNAGCDARNKKSGITFGKRAYFIKKAAKFKENVP